MQLSSMHLTMPSKWPAFAMSLEPAPRRCTCCVTMSERSSTVPQECKLFIYESMRGICPKCDMSDEYSYFNTSSHTLIRCSSGEHMEECKVVNAPPRRADIRN
jgi:hypothetical protein